VEKRKFGKTELETTVLGFGGAEIGHERAEQDVVTRILNEALDAGLNTIDTAAAYLASEQMIGNSVGHRRKEFNLFTKCGALEGFSRFDWSKDGVLETVRQSLKNLKTDYLDLIQLHSCDREILRRGECVEGLQRAVELGYTRYIGYSGDSQDAKFAVEMNVFDSLQTSINIADQEAIELTVPLAVERKMGVIAKRPIANAVWKHQEKPENTYVQEYWERIQKLKYDFVSEQDVPNSIGTALRFTLTVPGVSTAIVGTTKPGRWQENAAQVAKGNLTPEEFEAIRNRWREVADESWTGQT
jgi:aryl-alcohol dehydrogenase-like predicted oxidoreductase